jgi:hypothetical protein
VRYTNLKTGEVHVYTDVENEPDSSILADKNLRMMDCMDCHNRPSHEYYSPPFFTDISLTRGEIPKELPDIKQVAMGLLYADYESTDTAMTTIRNNVSEYYETTYPETFTEDYDMIEKAIQGIQEDFRQNIFPEMNARWKDYPNHIGHITSKGCLRCHDNNHRSESGRVISRDCNLCHTILAQGAPDQMVESGVRDSLEFKHPVDIGEAWKEFHCVDCHESLY